MTQGVSIIVCTFNGANRIKKTLNAILNLESFVEKELVLVDNASTDDTQHQVQVFFEENPPGFEVKLVREENPGLLYARVAGIKSARFDLLLFCDDDNWLFPDYLTIGTKHFKSNPNIGVVGGQGIGVLELEKPIWFDKYQKSFALGPQSKKSGIVEEYPGHVYGAGSFFRKSPLLKLINSGYRFQLTGRTQNQVISGDDLELCWLMQMQGYEIYYEEKLKFYHEIPASRISTNYLIKMKSGTAAGGALLFVYRFLMTKSSSSKIKFFFAFKWKQLFFTGLYFKNFIIHFFRKNHWENELNLEILKMKKDSFIKGYIKASLLFDQIQLYKDSWKFSVK